MLGRAFIASALLCLSCKRVDAVVQKDPTPPVDAARPTETERTGLALLHGRVVDVKMGSVLRVVFEKRVVSETVFGNKAYALGADQELRAWNALTGQSVVLKQPAVKVERFTRDGDFLVLVGSTWVELFDLRHDRTGHGHGAAGIEEGARIGDRVFARLGSSDVVPGYHAKGFIESVIEDHRHALASRSESICFAMFEAPNHRVECIDVDGKVLRTASISLARPGDSAGTRFHTRFISPQHIVIGTWSFGGFKSTRRAAVVRLSDLSTTIIEDEIVAAVERPDGSLEGLLVTELEVKLLEPSGAVRWTHKPVAGENFAAVALIEDRLVVAMYNAIATGVQVFALSVKSGKLLWTGETKLPPIAHSKYRNHVTLETLGDAVILRGHESSVDHVHVYDSKTGALRFSDAQ